MSDLRKAAEMALEALETLWDILDDIDTASDMAKENDAWYRKRVEALQKKRWDTMITTDGYKLKGGPVEALRQALAQPEQEPVAWMVYSVDGQSVCITDDPTSFTENQRALPLWPGPLEREWVGLDEDRVAYLADKYAPPIDPAFQNDDDYWKFYQEIESELKEKNT